MRIAELECEKAAETLVQCGLDLVRDVKLDRAALSLARDRLPRGIRVSTGPRQGPARPPDNPRKAPRVPSCGPVW